MEMRERKNVTAWEFNLLKPVDGVVIFPLISFVGNLFAYGYGCVCGFVEDFAFKKGIRGEKTRELAGISHHFTIQPQVDAFGLLVIVEYKSHKHL